MRVGELDCWMVLLGMPLFGLLILPLVRLVKLFCLEGEAVFFTA